MFAKIPLNGELLLIKKMISYFSSMWVYTLLSIFTNLIRYPSFGLLLERYKVSVALIKVIWTSRIRVTFISITAEDVLSLIWSGLKFTFQWYVQISSASNNHLDQC